MNKEKIKKIKRKIEWKGVCRNPHCILSALLAHKKDSLMTKEERE